MKIAQIAPLWNNRPSRGPSDSERTWSYLIAELVRRGHEVMLFGPRYDTRELERCRVSALKTRLMSVEPAMLSSLILLAPPLEKAMLRQAVPGRRPRL